MKNETWPLLEFQVDAGTVMYIWRETYKKGQEVRLVIDEKSRIVNGAGRCIPSDVRSRRDGMRWRRIGPCMAVYAIDNSRRPRATSHEQDWGQPSQGMKSHEEVTGAIEPSLA